MKIYTKKYNFEEMYQVGNVIQWINGNIYLVVDHGEYDYSLVDLTNNKVYATYDTLENLISELASESDVLVNAEINVFWGEIMKERIQMNENIKNMVEELKEKYPDDYGHFEGLTIDAIDRKDCDDTDDKFNEKILRELKICYKGKIIVLEKYYNDDWEIRDKHFLKTKEFREIVEILSIVMKHLSKIEFEESN